MTLEEKFALLAETIEAERNELNSDTLLETLEVWDSLAKLSVLAMFSSKLKRELEIDKIRNFRTVGDILDEMHE